MNERKFEKEIRAAAEKNQIPFELLYAQVAQESSFNPLATSKCGARGLLQLMPATGAEMGLKEHEFFDAEKNLEAGAAYLRRMCRTAKSMVTTMKCDNHCTEDDYYKLGLAAYNGGLGYVIKAINYCKQDNIPINWETVSAKFSDKRVAVKGHDPDARQTIDYVSKIWTDYKGGNNV